MGALDVGAEELQVIQVAPPRIGRPGSLCLGECIRLREAVGYLAGQRQVVIVGVALSFSSRGRGLRAYQDDRVFVSTAWLFRRHIALSKRVFRRFVSSDTKGISALAPTKNIPQQAPLRKPSEIDAPQMGARNIPRVPMHTGLASI